MSGLKICNRSAGLIRELYAICMSSRGRVTDHVVSLARVMAESDDALHRAGVLFDSPLIEDKFGDEVPNEKQRKK